MERKKYHILAVKRDARFSPYSEAKDRAILQLSSDLLSSDVPMIEESLFDDTYEADVYLSMARFPTTIQCLKRLETKGKIVVNSGFAVEKCSRSNLHSLMLSHQIPIPPSEGENGYWLKRGDAATQQEEDVVYCKDERSLLKAKSQFLARGITDMVVSAHVVGDVVKFYGVGHHFFRYFYPTDDRQTKFSHESVNGEAHHYAFDEAYLSHEAQRLADVISLDIYGGDAIIDKEGHMFIIDFNDWPSFSRCRNEAAEAIAKLIKDKMQ